LSSPSCSRKGISEQFEELDYFRSFLRSLSNVSRGVTMEIENVQEEIGGEESRGVGTKF